MTLLYAILTYNRSESLLGLLRSIFAQHLDQAVKIKIIIWDNASEPIHRERLLASEYLADARVEYIASPVNTYMVGKLDLERHILQHYDLTTIDFIAHLDDDVQLVEHWTHHALQACQNQGWDVCGSVENWQGDLIYSGQSQLHFETVERRGKKLKLWDWKWEKVIDRENGKPMVFAGHRAILCRAKVFADVLHDPQMLIGGEDLDFSLAVMQKGYTIGIHPQAFIHHRMLGEKDAVGFRTADKIYHSWKHFYQKWQFVRKNVYRELGISLEEWLEEVAQWSHY